jgi:hypothetical protein
VSENRVLRRIFRLKRRELAGGWRRLHNEELHNMYASQNIVRVMKSRRMRWAGLAYMGDIRSAHRIWVRNPEGKRPLVKPRRSWKDNIKMDLREIGLESVDWIHLAQDTDQWRALVNTIMDFGLHKWRDNY